MAKQLQYNKMGVNESDLKNASIRFIIDGSPVHKLANEFMLEDSKDDIRVVKDDKAGTLRPYLVLYNKLLHANTAMYMSSSLPISRIESENRVWGHHLVLTPKMLYNYIGVSALSGFLQDKSKISVIDKDKFLFVTDDSLVPLEQRAKGAGELEVGLMAHYTNLNKICSSLQKDLPPEHVEGVVKQGGSQRWHYRINEKNPILFNPASMYLALFVNASRGFTNYGLKLTPFELEERKRVTMLSIDALNAYGDFHRELEKLQNEDCLLYEVYKKARYYSHLITKTTYKKMEEEDKKSENGESGAWHSIAGHPIGGYTSGKIEDKILETMHVLSYKGKNQKKKIEYLLSLYEKEQEVNKMLSSCVNAVIENVNMSVRENINLSSFPFDLEAFYKMLTFKEEAKKETIYQYETLIKEFEQAFLRLRAKEMKRLAEFKKKELDKQNEILANAYAMERLKEDTEKSFLPTFFGAYKQYYNGTLLPSKEELDGFIGLTKLAAQQGNGETKIELGAELKEKLVSDFKAIKEHSGRIESSAKALKLLTEKLEGSQTEEDIVLLNAYLGELLNKVNKEQISASKKGKKVDIKEILAEILNLDANPDAIKYASVEFDLGTLEREFLADIQTVVNLKADLRAYKTLIEARVNLLSALNALNDPELISAYTETIVLSQVASANYLKEHNLKPLKSMEEIDKILSQVKKELSSPKLSVKDFIKLNDTITGIKAEMEASIAGYSMLREERRRLVNALIKYELIKEKGKAKINEALEEVYETIKGELKKHITLGGDEEFLSADSFSVVSKRGTEIYSITKEQADKTSEDFIEYNKECLDASNFSSLEKNKALFEGFFDKTFPGLDVLLSEMEKKAISSGDPKKASAIFKEMTSVVESQKKEMASFLSTGGSLILTALAINQENLMTVNNFDLLIGRMCEDLNAHLHSQYETFGEETEGEEEAVAMALKEGEKSLKKKARDDFYEYIDNLYISAEEILKNLPERTDLSLPYKDFLRTRTQGKTKIKNNAPMPQSVFGSHGIIESMEEVVFKKRNHVELLTDLVIGTEERNDNMYQNVLRFTAGYLKTFTDKARAEILTKQEEDAVAVISESIRKFALQSVENERFVTNKNCLEYLINMLNLKGMKFVPVKQKDSVADLSGCFRRAIYEVRKVLKSDKRNMPVGETDESILSELKELRRIYEEKFGSSFGKGE